MESAGFLARFVAWFLDALIIGFIGVTLAVVLVAMGSLGAVLADGNEGLAALLTGVVVVIFLLIGLLLEFVYFGMLWSRDGQSLGMKVLAIRVVRRDGETLSFIQAALRGTFGYWLSGLLFGLGFLWAAFDENQQAWHDKIFDTKVIQA